MTSGTPQASGDWISPPRWSATCARLVLTGRLWSSVAYHSCARYRGRGPRPWRGRLAAEFSRAGPGAGSGAAATAGRPRPAPDPAGPGGPAAPCSRATSPGSTRRRRPGRRPCLWHRASRPRRCRPAAATAARSSWRRSRSRLLVVGRAGQRTGEVSGVGAQRHLPSSRCPLWQGGQRAAQQIRRGRARVIGPVAQVGRPSHRTRQYPCAAT